VCIHTRPHIRNLLTNINSFFPLNIIIVWHNGSQWEWRNPWELLACVQQKNASLLLMPFNIYLSGLSCWFVIFEAS
jgi:hypothetical protein